MTQVAQQQCTDAEPVIVIKSPTEPSSTAVVTNNPSISITAGAVPGPHAQGKEQGQDGNDNSSSKRQAIKLSIRAYFSQWKGGVETPLKPEDPLVLLYSFAGAFTSILIIACINQYASPQPGFNVPYLVASFGASAVLVFGLPGAKLSQPRNLVGGQCLSALTGILVRLVLQPRWVGQGDFVSAALGMALSLTVMQATGTTHPPAGATGLLAGHANPIGDWWGFKFLLTVFLDAMTMLLVALIFNNLVPKRRYPLFW